MSVTETADLRPETPEPTCHTKRQSLTHVAVWPSDVGWKLMTVGFHGSFMSTVIRPFLPESFDMNASLRRLSTVMFSPSQNWVSVSPVLVPSVAAEIPEMYFGCAGSFSDQTLRPGVPLATMMS